MSSRVFRCLQTDSNVIKLPTTSSGLVETDEDVLETGTKMVPVEIGIRRYLQSKGISIEIQDIVRYCSL